VTDLARRAALLNSLREELAAVAGCLRAVKLSDSFQHVRRLKAHYDATARRIERLERKLK